MATAKEQEIVVAGGREVGISNPRRCSSPVPATRSSTWSSTTWPLPTVHCAGPATGRTSSSATRMESRRNSSTRSGLPLRARVDDGGDDALPIRPLRGRGGAARRRRPGLDGQPRLHRAAPASRSGRRPRSSRRTARRPRPGAGRRMAAGARRWPAWCTRRSKTSAWSAGRRRQDRAASTSTSALIGAGRSTRCAARRSPSPARWSGGRRRLPRANGGRRSGTACSSTTTRTRKTARSPRAYSVRPTPDARVSAPLDWDEIDACDPADFTLATMPGRFAELGDRHAAIDDARGLARAAARTLRAPGARRARRRAVAPALHEAGRRARPRPAVAPRRVRHRAPAPNTFASSKGGVTSSWS